MELTKGTWKKRRSATGSWVIDTDDELIAKEIRECNADAIAAVPEMVEALELVLPLIRSFAKTVNTISTFQIADPGKEYMEKIAIEAEAALAKARGEQQDET